MIRQVLVLLCVGAIMGCATLGEGLLYPSTEKAFLKALNSSEPMRQLSSFADKHPQSKSARTARMLLRWDRRFSLLGAEAKKLKLDIGREGEYVDALSRIVSAYSATVDSSRSVFLDLGIDVDGPTPEPNSVYDGHYGRPNTYSAAISWHKEAVWELNHLTRELTHFEKDAARMWEEAVSDSSAAGILSFQKAMQEGRWSRSLVTCYVPLIQEKLAYYEARRFQDRLATVYTYLEKGELRSALIALQTPMRLAETQDDLQEVEKLIRAMDKAVSPHLRKYEAELSFQTVLTGEQVEDCKYTFYVLGEKNPVLYKVLVEVTNYSDQILNLLARSPIFQFERIGDSGAGEEVELSYLLTDQHASPGEATQYMVYPGKTVRKELTYFQRKTESTHDGDRFYEDVFGMVLRNERANTYEHIDDRGKIRVYINLGGQAYPISGLAHAGS